MNAHDGLPYVALEALAVGLPIVATTSAGCRLVVDSGCNGFIVPAGDCGAFSEALIRVVRDQAVRWCFGKESLARADAFCLDEMVAKIIDTYYGLLHR